MKKTKKITVGIIGAAAGLAAGSVYAADSKDWTGFNFYGGVGFNSLEKDYSLVGGSNDDDNTHAFAGTQSKSKGTGKLGLGYDAKINDNLVVGVFADVNLGSITNHTSKNWDNGNYTLNTSTKVKDAYSVGAKIGYLASDNDLIFVSGGASSAKFKTDYTVEGSSMDDALMSSNKSKTGLFLGLGLEHKVNDHLSVVGDYRVTDYGNVTLEQYADNGNMTQFQKSGLKTKNLSLNLKYKL